LTHTPLPPVAIPFVTASTYTVRADLTRLGQLPAHVRDVGPPTLVRLDADAVPVAPETRAVCDALGVDPLALISSGAMLIAVRDPWPVQDELARAGIPSAVVGALTPGPDRVVVRDGHTSPLEPPDRDELWRVLGEAGKS